MTADRGSEAEWQPRYEVASDPAPSDRARRVLYRIALPAFNVFQRVGRPVTRSVACVIMCGPEVLLVRHTYRDEQEWTLPGGLRRQDEKAHSAARREMEEAGLTARCAACLA